MRRPSIIVPLAAAAVLAASVAAAAAGAPAAPPAQRVKNTRGWIGSLAMNGPVVAYSVGANPSNPCTKLFAWNVVTGAGWLLSGKGTCEADSTSTGGGVVQIAIGGRRFAWIVNLGGNTESDDNLYTAALPNPVERRLATATRYGDIDGALGGRWIGGLVGGGDLLAVNRWTTDQSGNVIAASLERIGASALITRIARGAATTVARSADLGRIAVLRTKGDVALYSVRGALLRTIVPTSSREVALRKDYLVVLTRARTLEIYNANTGAFVRRWQVPGGATNLDVHTGIAVFSVWRTLYALRLTTGRAAVVVRAKRAIVAAQIEGPGVAYAFNTVRGIRDLGNVGFVPMSRVSRAIP